MKTNFVYFIFRTYCNESIFLSSQCSIPLGGPILGRFAKLYGTQFLCKFLWMKDIYGCIDIFHIHLAKTGFHKEVIFLTSE